MKVQTKSSSARFNGLFKVFSILIIIASLFSSAASAQELNARKHGTVKEQIEQSALNQKQDLPSINDILTYAFKFRGTPYRRGQMSPRGFDCSGFTSYVFKNFGIQLTRTAYGQIADGRRVDRSELHPGDLVFFSGRGGGPRIGHVGIVTKVENEHDFKFIHACSRGVTESHSSETYYSRRYRGACRVVEGQK